MRTFIISSFVALSLVALGQAFAVDKAAVATSIINTKNEFISDTKDVIGNLKDSALSKAAAIHGSVNAVANAKVGFAKTIKDIKIALLKGAAAAKFAKYSALKKVKDSFDGSFIANKLAAKKAHLNNLIAAITAKTQGFFEHKLAFKEQLKDTATSLFSGAVSKVHDEVAKKKSLLSLLKTPKATNAMWLVPVVSQKPYKLHTYVSNEAPVVGKVFVQEIPIQKPETITPQPSYGPPASSYGPPATSYRPPAISFEPPAQSYGPPAISFEPPAQSYGPPATSYGPPAQSYGPPTVVTA